MSDDMTHDILRALQDLAGDDDPAEADIPDADAPVERRVRDMMRRTGMIDGVRCFVEETPHGTFRLHGFRDGNWRLSREGWVGDADEQPVQSRQYTLSFLHRKLGHAVHAIESLSTIREADAFFGEAGSVPWKATNIDGGTQREVTPVSG